jgi:hypothetical protein
MRPGERRLREGIVSSVDAQVEAAVVAAMRTYYSGVAPDLGWAERAPDDDEFDDVMRDRLEHMGLPAGVVSYFRGLPRVQQQRVLRRVGP